MKKKSLKILIASDKFKGSLSAHEVVESLREGILKTYSAAEIICQPMADGGDGSVDLLNEIWQLSEHKVSVHDPLFRTITTSYFSKRQDAFIEMAKASGLALLKPSERNPLKTTTLGTGELIADALEKRCKSINLFIGGSATNDAAIGIATALGFDFYDKNKNKLSPTGGSLSEINSIISNQKLNDCRFRIICDVNNPFYGETGAAYVYAKQKGANESMIEQLDEGLKNINTVFKKYGFGDVQNLSGAGAAGGVGGGMKALFNAELISGIDFFIELFDLEEKVKSVDFVITGEGQLDEQSLQGKVVGGILKLCKKYKKPLIVICGQNKLNDAQLTGIRKVKSITDKAPSIETAIKEAPAFLRKTGEELTF